MDIMLDIETLATGPNSVVITLGAIRFDPFTNDEESIEGDSIRMDTFYRRIDPESFIWPTAEIDDTTLAWWAKQSKEVQPPQLNTKDQTRDDDNCFGQPTSSLHYVVVGPVLSSEPHSITLFDVVKTGVTVYKCNQCD